MTPRRALRCTTPRWRARWPVKAGYLALLLLLQACGVRPYQPSELDSAGFLQRAQTQTEGAVTVRAAVPDAAETLALTGLDLYAQQIQPLWLQVSNRGGEPLRASLWSIDRDYYSPIEVAYMNRSAFSTAGYHAMEKWFHQNGLPRQIAPGETRSGLVFTHLKPGTKGFNFDLFSPSRAMTFTFFLALPGFDPDYLQVDYAALYPPEGISHYQLDQLDELVGAGLPCCSTNVAADGQGGPFNVVLVGTPRAVRRSLMRGGWLETPVDERDRRPVEERQFFQGRNADGRFYLDRQNGDIRLVMDIWLGPWQVDGTPVWLVQAYYQERSSPLVAALRQAGALEKSTLLARFLRESVFADIDSARSFVMQNFWYNQSLNRMGLVPGVGARTIEAPGETFDGLGYFTDGLRVLLFLSETPVAMGQTEVLETADGLDQKAPAGSGK